MPNLPDLPTDSLYKFLALLGMVLFLARVIVPKILVNRLRDYVNELMIEVAPVKAEIGYLEGEIDDVKNQGAPDSEEGFEILRGRMTGMKAKVQELGVKSAIVDAKIRIAEERRREMVWLYVVMVAGGLSGGLLMASGFRLWYDRLQKYQDMIVAAEAARIDRVPQPGNTVP